jgi:hypothetical protein
MKLSDVGLEAAPRTHANFLAGTESSFNLHSRSIIIINAVSRRKSCMCKQSSVYRLSISLRA